MIAQTAPKWYNHDRDLKQCDMVYFRKTEGPIKGPWTMGMVDSVTKGRDLLVREARVRYHTSDDGAPQFTDRAVRSLVRLFNIDEINWQDDLDRVAEQCSKTSLDVGLSAMQAFIARPRPGNSAKCFW